MILQEQGRKTVNFTCHYLCMQTKPKSNTNRQVEKKKNVKKNGSQKTTDRSKKACIQMPELGPGVSFTKVRTCVLTFGESNNNDKP